MVVSLRPMLVLWSGSGLKGCLRAGGGVLLLAGCCWMGAGGVGGMMLAADVGEVLC